MGKVAGVLIFLLIVLGGGIWYLFGRGGDESGSPGIGGLAGGSREEITLKGLVGGEKVGLLQDPDVQRILSRKYGIRRLLAAGSIEMVREPGSDIDFLWPSSQVALELFKQEHRSRLRKAEIIFNSPIVLYSWSLVADALTSRGIVEKIDATYYVVDMPRLLELVTSGRKWSDVGLGDLYGSVTIISTDPTKSNSGNMFSGLLANLLNNGEVVDDTSIETVLPEVVRFFRKLGYLEHSSGDLFDQYLRTGVGAKPIIVGYENQIVEFSLEHADLWPQVKDEMRILYPVPTVWSSHPIMALSPRGEALVQALMDPDLQRIAWEKHGFRTGLMGVENDPSVLAIAGIPAKITKVIQMPSPLVMDRIIESLAGESN
ncbi:MAG: hypothetical protein R3E12_03105 [Candidatus Eisenbacteria bacterium]